MKSWTPFTGFGQVMSKYNSAIQNPWVITSRVLFGTSIFVLNLVNFEESAFLHSNSRGNHNFAFDMSMHTGTSIAKAFIYGATFPLPLVKMIYDYNTSPIKFNRHLQVGSVYDPLNYNGFQKRLEEERHYLSEQEQAKYRQKRLQEEQETLSKQEQVKNCALPEQATGK